ncbi:MAG: TonB family protein [Prevotella sp.]|nr:TonB family protein [Prevotella sp.]MBR3481204.1 TonB family protein [Prevotella sp.]MBR6189090.1 TonB family protein [Prevotella sp.]
MLEQKKSPSADLERHWLQRFLLGLLLALTTFYVALEYNITPDDPLDDPDLLEQLTLDPELSSLLRPENELALAPKAEPKPTTKLVVADEEVELEPQQEEQPVETDVNGDMEAQEDTEEELMPPPPDDDEAVSFRVVEDLPQFPGGPVEMMKWLTRNLKYPKQLEERKIQGKVVAEFIVNKDGSITNVNIAVPSTSIIFDREVARVLRMMPRWTAGMQDGKPCRTKVCIPVVFRL